VCLGQDVPIKLQWQKGHQASIDRICISPNQKYIASFSSDLTVVVWDYNSGYEVSAFNLQENVAEYGLFIYKRPEGFLFSDKGDSLQIKFENYPTAFICVIANEKIHSLPSNKVKGNLRDSIYFEPEKLATILEASINVWQLPTKRRIHQATCEYFEDPFTSLDYDRINKRFFAASSDGYIYVFNHELKEIGRLGDHLNSVNDLVVSPDGKFLISASSDRSIIRWNLATTEALNRISGFNFPITDLDISQDQSQLAFSDELGNVSRLQVLPNSLQMETDELSMEAITQLNYLSDSLFFSGGKEQTMYWHKWNQTPQGLKLDFSKRFSHSIIQNRGVKGLIRRIIGMPPDDRRPALIKTEIDTRKKIVFTEETKSFAGKKTYFRFYKYSQNNIQRSKPCYPEIRTIGFLEMAVPYNTSITRLNDSTFLASVSPIKGFNKKTDPPALYAWRIQDGDLEQIAFQHTDFPREINRVARITDTLIAYLSGTYLFYYDVYKDQHVQIDSNCIEVLPLKNGQVLIQYADFSFRILNKDGQYSPMYTGHEGPIKQVKEWSKYGQLITASSDGTLRIWNRDQANLIASLVPAGVTQFALITPDNYYCISSRKVQSFGFKQGKEFFLAEQFDAFYNRPDIVYDRLGYFDSTVIQMYRDAYLKRIRKLGFTEEMLNPDFHFPEITVLNKDSLNYLTEKETISLQLACKDSKHNLDRINVWINDVPVFGKQGIDLKRQATNLWFQELPLSLISGNNKIQVSVLNAAGVESQRESIFIRYNPVVKKSSDLYVIAIGVSQYQQSDYNLRYAEKDANDLVAYFSENEYKAYDSLHVFRLTNENVTKENILQLKYTLNKAGREDAVVLAYAGHGSLDEQYNYFLSTYDMDFNNPGKRGLAYEEFEQLLDGIQPLKKVLMIDACHSGELDKETISAVKSLTNVNAKPVGRGIVIGIEPEPHQLNTSTMARELFADLRRGTGATVISASGGMEFAMESSTWKNGLFTYALLNGLKSDEADVNKDGKIMLSELQKYVASTVNALSGGQQQPNARSENLSVDFRLK
jgi:WD40 repeat protein